MKNYRYFLKSLRLVTVLTSCTFMQLVLIQPGASADIYRCNGEYRNTECKEGEQYEAVKNLPEVSRVESRKVTEEQEFQKILSQELSSPVEKKSIVASLSFGDQLQALGREADQFGSEISKMVREEGVSTTDSKLRTLRAKIDILCARKSAKENFRMNARCQPLQKKITRIRTKVQSYPRG